MNTLAAPYAHRITYLVTAIALAVLAVHWGQDIRSDLAQSQSRCSYTIWRLRAGGVSLNFDLTTTHLDAPTLSRDAIQLLRYHDFFRATP
ncbi:hypothetical protein PoB_006312800 [Plakobranchus ocellatus]|uniref:Uncharacterized protein n=1 Tax=Plakobranchus ocellatus TaxID=259542 RepID=A0AAV4CXQ1_9GAST|nr:hypothetical protein PoB_006312800 [Plakobranchus ocellatus]